MNVTPLTLAATIGITVLGLALTVLFDAWWGSIRWASVGMSLAISAIGWAAWLASVSLWRPELDGRLVLPLAALAGVASILAGATLRLLGVRYRTIIAFTTVWVFAVFVPVAFALFSLTNGILGAGLRTLDLAGALPVMVAAGSSGAAVLVIERRRTGIVRDIPTHRWLLPVVLGIVWLLWILWLAGLELAIDEATGRIILNSLVSPIACMLAWLVVQRVRHSKTTGIAAAGGLFCGLVAIAPGCGYFNVLGATLTGLITGALCSLVGYRLVRRTGQPAWLLGTILVVGAGTGLVLLGAFAMRAGLMFTGQPEVLYSQFASVAIVIVYTGVVSLPLWFGVRAVFERGSRARTIEERMVP